MLVLLFLILIAILLLALMAKNFYLYSQRNDPSTVGRTALISAIIYLILALVLFILAIVMMRDNKVQYTVQFNKMVKQE